MYCYSQPYPIGYSDNTYILPYKNGATITCMGTPWYVRAKQALKQQGVRYIDVAAACGVTESAVGHWLNGRRFPNVEEARIIARLAGMSLDDMFGDDPHHIVLSEDEAQLVTQVRKLSKEQRETIVHLLKHLKD